MKEHHTPGPLVTIRMKDWEDIRAQLNGAKGSLGACRQREDALRAELDSKVADICNLGDNLRVVEAELAASRKEAEALRERCGQYRLEAQAQADRAEKMARLAVDQKDALDVALDYEKKYREAAGERDAWITAKDRAESRLRALEEALRTQIARDDEEGFTHNGCRASDAKCYLCRALSSPAAEAKEKI